jgi:hypothetical protein
LAAVEQFNQLLQDSISPGDGTTLHSDPELLTPILATIRTHLLLEIQIDRLRRADRDPSVLLARLHSNWAQLEDLEPIEDETIYTEIVEQAIAIVVNQNKLA